MAEDLYLAGGITKRLKTLNKQFMAALWQAVAHKPIWVFLAAAVVSIPCLAEPPAINVAKVTPELMCGGKVIGKDLDQSAVKRMSAKPSENGRVNSGAECGSGNSKTGAILAPSSKVVDSQVAKQDNGSAYECGEYCGFYVWLLFLFAWPLLFPTKKPNVK